MAREQFRRLAERELRPYRAGDEPAVLALWARALPGWPVSAEAFRSKTTGAGQLVMVAGGALAGYIAVTPAETRAQLTAILVDPACRRAGIGSELLAQARRNLGGGVRSLSAGSGAGPYFWPGVPEDAPDAWAFLRAHGFEPAGKVADLLADIARFRPPEWVLSRAGGGVRFELAAKGDAAQVIALQERHFPGWKAFYEHHLTLPGTVLVARADGQIVGTCTVEGPAEYHFLWRALIPAAVGAFGCVGVDPAARQHGIGLAMVARACELLSARGAEVCYCAYTYLEDWYAQLGFTRWRGYTSATANARRDPAIRPCPPRRARRSLTR
jgi:ribosomal protein S18 acetylase RimI-like enzyme